MKKSKLDFTAFILNAFFFKAIFVVLMFLAGPIAVPSAKAQETKSSPSFAKIVRPILNQYCVSCHGPDEQEARLRYDQLDGFQLSDRHLWTMIYQQVAAGDMPPEGESQLDESEKTKLLDWIEKEQRALGTGSTRRLNRREFGNALQDLTGVDVDFAYSLPGDGKVDGFDTGAEALQDAADSVNQMLEVTRRAVEAIRFLEPAKHEVMKVDLVNVEKDPRRPFDTWKRAGIRLEKLPRIAMPGVGALLEPKWPKDRSSSLFRVPPPPKQAGLFRVKFSLNSYSAFPGVPHPIAWIKIGGRVLDRREIAFPTDLEYVVQLEDSIIGSKGLAVSITPRVELPYRVKGFENEDKSKPSQLPDGAGLFRPAWDKKKLRKPEQQPRPFLVLKAVEFEPEYVATWPPKEWNSEIDTITDSPTSAKQLLSLWMNRAYRRPVKASEQDHFYQFYKSLREQGFTFDQALRSTFQSVLMSQPFRYLASNADENQSMADHAVASRLSFMLVGTLPDESLRELAASGKLRSPEILKEQALRLLDDPRNYSRFIKPFVSQWLEMEQPLTLVDDRLGKASYHFRRYLQDSMREETYRYVQNLISENRPAREIVSSDWTMMNDILARYYDYPEMGGGQLRKIKLRDNDPRGGGILSHAGIQSMLCWMGDNWVIYRGAWTAKHILADPPQLPPLEVPELDPSSGKLKRMTPRELMAFHREDKKCSVCHTKLDPIGFAFQNFDLSGRWRDVEFESYSVDELDGKVAWRGKGKSRPVDSVGQLPRGETFNSYAEFKSLIVKHYQKDMVRGLLKNFLLYATGRKPDIDDLAEMDAIMEKHADRDYPLRDMLLAIFQTQAFLDH